MLDIDAFHFLLKVKFLFKISSIILSKRIKNVQLSLTTMNRKYKVDLFL